MAVRTRGPVETPVESHMRLCHSGSGCSRALSVWGGPPSPFLSDLLKLSCVLLRTGQATQQGTDDSLVAQSPETGRGLGSNPSVVTPLSPRQAALSEELELDSQGRGFEVITHFMFEAQGSVSSTASPPPPCTLYLWACCGDNILIIAGLRSLRQED